jgi:hypothetical protein
MTVAGLRDEMGNSEFLGWQAYYTFIAQQQELETLKTRKGGRRG